jgi:hypothetical protein
METNADPKNISTQFILNYQIKLGTRTCKEFLQLLLQTFSPSFRQLARQLSSLEKVQANKFISLSLKIIVFFK